MPRYPFIQRALHWIVAFLVLGTLIVGLMIGIFEFDGLVAAYGQATTNLIYKYHKTFGVLILGFMVIRTIVKLRLGKPAYAPPLSDFDRRASATVHGLLYVCLLAMPVLGWLGTGAGGFPVEFFDWKLPGIVSKDKALSDLLFELHEMVGWTIMLLVGLHIGGALKHAIINMDKVMDRML
jgi:cytochrome b561